MKKCIVVLFSLILSANWFCGQNTHQKMPNYPPYNQVAEKYATEYLMSEIQSYSDIRYLAKKPDGWHILKMDYETKKILEDDLFWDRKSRKFLPLAHAKNIRGKLSSQAQQFIKNSNSEYLSGIIPYWGYPGWEKDVIDEFGDKRNLSDSLLNGLARTYSNLARNNFSVSEFVDMQTFQELPKGQNSLNEKQLQEFLKYENLSIATYKQLFEKFPEFESIVADAKNMYANEIVSCYFSLRCYQNEKMALKQLKSGLYDEFYLEMARNFLSSCEQDAILFVNGDMDTFPLLYVQANENYRKDVLVINLSYLNLGRYINHLIHYQGGAKPLSLSIDSNSYKNDKFNVFMINEKLKMASLNGLLEFATSDKPETKLKLANGEMQNYLPTKNIYLKINFDNINEKYKQELTKIDTAINLTLNGNYLYLSDFCQLDIINSNAFKRPIYYAMTVSKENYQKVENYLQNEGFAYKLVPYKSEPVLRYNVVRANTNIMYNKIENELNFDAAIKNKLKLTTTHKRLINNYRRVFGDLALQLIHEGKYELAVNVLDKSMLSYPLELVEPNYFMLPFIDCYFQLKKPEMAIKIAKIYFATILNKIKENTNQKSEDSKQEMRVSKYELFELQKLFENYQPDNKMLEDIENQLNKMDAQSY